MIKLPKSPISSIKIAKNGVKTALLKTTNGISAIGAYFSIGAQDSPSSGQTFLTFHSKLLDSIGSPQNMFRYGITPYLNVYRDKTNILLTFLPESTKYANMVLDQMFSSNPPSSQSVVMAKQILAEQEKAGNITFEEIFEEVAHIASYNDPKQRIGVYNNDPALLRPNDAILTNLKSSAILFGTADEESNLTSLAASLGTYKPKEYKELKFTSGICSKKATTEAFKGSVLQKNQEMRYGVLSFPAASSQSDDYFTFKVIQKIFGGGSEFSSDGLGVGINSLIYKNCLSFGTEFLRCFYFPGQKNGLLSFGFKAEQDSMELITKKLARCVKKALELNDYLFKLGKEEAVDEFLKSTDNAHLRLFDFGKQAMIWGEAKDTTSIIDSIRSVSKDKIINCLKETFSHLPSVGIIGEKDPQILQQKWKQNIE